jgi:hypothetical protein
MLHVLTKQVILKTHLSCYLIKLILIMKIEVDP